MSLDERIALISEKSILTYKQLKENVYCLSKIFNKGSVNILICNNSIDSIILYLSLIKAKAIPILLNVGVSENTINNYVKSYRVKNIITPNEQAFNSNNEKLSFGEFAIYKLHNEIIIKEDDVLDILPLIGEIYDEPFSDNSFVPSFILSKFARLKVKSCLSGDGGDELFGGYRRYFNSLKINRIASNKVFRFFSKFLSIQDINDFNLKYNSKIYFRFMKLLNYSKHSNTKMLYKKLVSFKNVFKFYDSKTNILQEDNYKVSETELKKFMMDFDFSNYLPENNLTKMDRASMKNSLEVRSPLLSKEILEFLFKIDPNLRINNDRKYLIKKILEKYIPNSFFERPKRGFSIPLNNWLNDKLFSWTAEILTKSNLILIGIVNHKEILETWNDKNRRNFYIYEYWNLIVYILWFKNTFSKK